MFRHASRGTVLPLAFARVVHATGVDPARGRQAGPQERKSFEVRDEMGSIAHVTFLFPARPRRDDELHECTLVPGMLLVLFHATCVGRWRAAFGDAIGTQIPCFRVSPAQHAIDGSFGIWAGRSVSALGPFANSAVSPAVPAPYGVFPRLSVSCCASWLFRAFGLDLPGNHGSYSYCMHNKPAPEPALVYARALARAGRALVGLARLPPGNAPRQPRAALPPSGSESDDSEATEQPSGSDTEAGSGSEDSPAVVVDGKRPLSQAPMQPNAKRRRESPRP